MNSRTPELSRLTLMCRDHEVAEFTWNHDRQAVTGKTHVLDAAHAPLMATELAAERKKLADERDRLAGGMAQAESPELEPEDGRRRGPRR